jgi:hypothetical protein
MYVCLLIKRFYYGFAVFFKLACSATGSVPLRFMLPSGIVIILKRYYFIITFERREVMG